LSQGHQPRCSIPSVPPVPKATKPTCDGFHPLDATSVPASLGLNAEGRTEPNPVCDCLAPVAVPPRRACLQVWRAVWLGGWRANCRCCLWARTYPTHRVALHAGLQHLASRRAKEATSC
jgi:hypothetical protein